MPSIFQAPPPPAPSSSSSSSRAKVNGTTYTSLSRRSMLPSSHSSPSSSSYATAPDGRSPRSAEPSSLIHLASDSKSAEAQTNGSSSFDHADMTEAEEIGNEGEDDGVNGAYIEAEEEDEQGEISIEVDGEDEGEDEDDEEETDEDSDSDVEDERTVVHVEVRLRPDNIALSHNIERNTRGFIGNIDGAIPLGDKLHGWTDIGILDDNVDRIWVDEGVRGESSVKPVDANIQLHMYRAIELDVLQEFSADFDDDEEEKVTAASMRILPSLELDGIWETLVYADDLKTRLLDFIYTTIHFSELEIDSNVVAWNRVVLLHGPPGTGKTSLCRALAQKIAIRLGKTYHQGKLIEINSHSLFSKWFSESGKLVQRLFETVTREVDDENQFVVVMIDEVESLTAARAGAMRGNEPSDSLRVVNALLTQLDKLRTRKNVLVMTTSNLVDAIDEAFISRVDMQEYVPLPPPQAVYHILSGCLQEMMDKGLVKVRLMYRWDVADKQSETVGQTSRDDRIGGALAALAKRCHSLNLSGRTLRKLPVLAHARFLPSSSGQHRPRRIERSIEAMNKYVDIEENKKKEEAVRAGLRENTDRHHNGVNGISDDAGTGTKEGGHARIGSGSIDRSEIGRMVGLAIAGEGQKGSHQHH
ncbi:hypothetical protein IAT40_000670 [Kwoniella sp. CBS 6097]